MTRNTRRVVMGRPQKYRRELNIKRIREIKERKHVATTRSEDKKINEEKESTHQSTIVTPPKKDVEQDSPSSSPPERKEAKFLQNEDSPLLGHHRKKKARVNKSDNEEKSSMKSGNRLIDLHSLVSMIEKNTVCKFCGSVVQVAEETVGISTSLKLECTCETCNNKEETSNHRTHFPSNRGNYKSVESYASNVFFVLGLQQIGAGASECGIVITYLNLPNSASFKSKSFNRIESCIRPTVKKLTQQSIECALQEEIKKTILEEKPPRARVSLLRKFNERSIEKEDVPLTICYDMGWNKRSSGTRYDSVSGHGLMIGGYTKKVIGYKSLSKECSVCSKFLKKRGMKKHDNLPEAEEESKPEPHECTKNHEGSSKSMECEAVLDLVKEAFFERNFVVGTIVADDDTTMKKMLRHNYKDQVSRGILSKNDWPKNIKGKPMASGKLPDLIPPPKFLADFNHRVKSVGRAVYELAMLSKSKSMVDKNLAKRLKLYWSKMLQQVKKFDLQDDWEEIEKRVRAPIEHIFNNHLYCQETWCYALKAKNENKTYIPDDKRPFYCKVEDKKMYEQINESLSKFQTKENVRECLHSFDTQKNESVNNAIARVAPKFKHFGTTPALDTRISTVVGYTNMGYEEYYRTLLCMLVNSDSIKGSLIESGIKRTGKIKDDNKKRKRTKKFKRDRTHGKESKTQREVYEARIDKKNNMGTYKGSIAMNDSSDDDDDKEIQENTQQLSGIDEMNQQVKQGKQEKPIKTNCPWCKKTDHKTWRSVRCSLHQQYLQQKPTKRKKSSSTRRTSTSTTHQNEEEEKCENEVSGMLGVVDGGDDDEPVVDTIDIAMSDVDLLLAIGAKNK